MPDPTQQEITPEEIEKMRAIVANHDRITGINEFDLNRPKAEPYHYEAFPKLIYSSAKDKDDLDKKQTEGWKAAPTFTPEPRFPMLVFRAVQDKEDLEKHLKEGGKETPPDLTPAKEHASSPPHTPNPSHYSGLDPDSAAEAAEADRKLKEKPKGK